MRRVLLVLIPTLGLLWVHAAVAQRVHISPVPVVSPRNGEILAGLAEGVYLDADTDRYVVVAHRENGDTLPVVAAFSRRNRSTHSMRATVATLSPASKAYDYQLQRQTQDSIEWEQVDLLLPNGSVQTAKSSSNGSAVVSETGFVDPFVFSTKTLQRLSLRKGKSTRTLGGQYETFSFASTFLPGFVTAFIYDEVPEDTATNESELAVLKAQLHQVVSPDYLGRMVVVVGPRFAPGTPKAEVARALAFSCEYLAAHGEIDPTSQFIRDSVAFLKTLGHQTSTLAVREQSLDTTFLERAQTEIERDIASIIKVSILEREVR